VSRQIALNSRGASATLVGRILPCSFCHHLHGCLIGCKQSCTLVLLQVAFQDEVTEEFGLEGTFKGHLVQPPLH